MYVVPILGQSNAVGRAGLDGLPYHPAGVLQYDQAGALVAPTTPLDHRITTYSDEFGPDVQFSRAFMAANPGAQLVFIPCADGGTGFFDNMWNPGDPAYDDAVTRINAFAASYPDAVFSAVIWVQGEDEGAASAQWSQAQYATALDSMIAALRLDAPAISATPFIAVEIGAGDDGLTPNGSQIRAAIRDTPNRVANTLFVSASGLFETVDTLDPLHFGPNGQRGMGQRIYNAMAGEVAAYGGVNSGPDLLSDPDLQSDYDWIHDSEFTVGNGEIVYDSGGDSSANVAIFNRFMAHTVLGRTYRATWTIEDYAHSTGASNTLILNGFAWTGPNVNVAHSGVTVNSNGVHSMDFEGADAPFYIRCRAKPKGGTMSFRVTSVTFEDVTP